MEQEEVQAQPVQSPEASTTPTLDVRGLTKRYGDFTAVSDLSFSLHQGDVMGFLGPNGAGKTTTMRMLTTFLPPTEGTALVNGNDILADANAVRRIIGYMPENPPVYEEMTVVGFLRFLGTLRQVPRVELRDRIDHVIRRTHLEEKAKATLGTLSKGFRQRVGLAQAILHDPQVLILDEPTAGLDPHQVREIRTLIKELAEAHTILLCTHILPEVVNICSRLVILNRGCKVYDETLSGDDIRSLEERFIRLTLDSASPEEHDDAASTVATQPPEAQTGMPDEAFAPDTDNHEEEGA